MTVSSTDPLPRHSFVPSRPATRLLLAGGLTLAGWLLSVALSTSAASADETPTAPADPGTVATQPVTPVTADPSPPAHTDPAPVTPPASPVTSAPVDKAPPTSGDSGSGSVTTPAKPVADAPATADTPAEPVDSAAEQETPAPVTPAALKPAAKTHVMTSHSQSSGGLLGLLGGTLNSLVSTVGGTVDSLTNVVGTFAGTAGDVGGSVFTPPDEIDPGSASVTLPVVGDLISGGSTSYDSDGWSGGGSMTVSIPLVSDLSLTITAPAATPAPVARPAAPVAAQTSSFRIVTAVSAPSSRHAAPQRPADRQGNSDKYAGLGGGGSGGGGGGLPAAPSAPAAPTTVSAGHDTNGSARHPLAVFGSSDTTTQLRLVGTSRDHAADGAGREAALPTTSPD
jgi:hypothetical protein